MSPTPTPSTPAHSTHSHATPPARHPDRPCRVPAGIKAFSTLLGHRVPDAGHFRYLGECLNVGDAPADALVEWMYADGMATTRPLFERALAEGIDSVPDAPQSLVEFFRLVETVPAWVNREQLDLGAAVMRSGGADGLYIARDVALLGGYMFSGFNQTLLRTGALEKGSNTRFAETTRWALDVVSEGGLEVGGAGYRATVRVRMIHALVRRHVSAMDDWDPDIWGLPINQTDMAATLVGSLIAPSVGGIAMGRINTPREYDAIAHLTRYVGLLMGVQDDFLPRSFRDGVGILYHTSCALSTPDETTQLLSRPMIDDPLTWNYPRFEALRRRIARHQHLSVTSAFLGPSAMRTLGLPTFVPPWYPVAKLPVNLVRSLATLRPGGRERAARRGWDEQERFMTTMVPSGEATIGHAARTITHQAA